MKHDSVSTLYSCLIVLARESGVPLRFDLSPPLTSLNERFDPMKDSGVQAMADHVGITVTPIRINSVNEIQNFPFLSILKNGNVVLVHSFDSKNSLVQVYDPLSEGGVILNFSSDVLENNWTGKIFYLQRIQQDLVDSSENIKINVGSWVADQLGESKFNYNLIFLIGFLINLLSLISPFFLMIVLDRVVAHNAWATLTVLGVAVCVVVVFEAIFDYLKAILTLLMAKTIDLKMQTKLYEHFLSLQYAFLKHGKKGVWARTLTEPERIRAFITNRALNNSIDIVFVVIFAVAMAWMNLTLLAIVTFGAVLQLLIASAVNPLVKKKINNAVMADNRKEAFLAESIASIDVIKALGAERINYRYWKTVIGKSIENRHNLQLLLAGIKGLAGLIDKTIYIIVIWLGASLVMQGEMTIGIMVAASILTRRITSPIMQLATLINDYHEIKASARAIDHLTNQSREQDNQSGVKLSVKVIGQFDFSKVRYSYPGNNVFDVFLDISLPINSMISIAGSSGSGKSTLIKLLLGLVAPTEGVVRIDGNDIRNLDFENYRNQIGTVLQDTQLFNGTVKDNISFGVPSASLDAIIKASRLAGADEFIQRLPEGYGTFLDENAFNLSGGQRQRIALARALLRNPRVLLLDEATSALDPESEGIIMNSLQKIRLNKTIIMVSHRLSSIVNSDLIIWMENGEILAHGTHDQLLISCNQYRKLWISQNSYN